MAKIIEIDNYDVSTSRVVGKLYINNALIVSVEDLNNSTFNPLTQIILFGGTRINTNKALATVINEIND